MLARLIAVAVEQLQDHDRRDVPGEAPAVFGRLIVAGMTGDADPKGSPVGTTVAMIEQGSQVMSTIHRLLHVSLSRELRLRYDLCRRFAPTDGYPYDVAGEQRTIFAEDFQAGVDIVPVSDPNIFSTAQALEIARAVYQLSMENPDLVPRPIALRRLLTAMRVPDLEELLPEQPEPQVYDPVGEVQALLLGKPVQVRPEQDHVAHLKHLWAFASNPEFGGNPQVKAQVGPNLIALIGRHMAYAWATHVRGAGIPAPYMDPQSGQTAQPEIPPEQIAQAVAQIAPQMAQVPGIPAVIVLGSPYQDSRPHYGCGARGL